MKTVVHCSPDQFCIHQKETGGEYNAPLVLHCMSEKCGYPDKVCLFVKMGGERE